MSIDWYAVMVIAINIILYLLIDSIPKMGFIRGGAISGWISSFIGFYIILFKKINNVNFIDPSYIFIYALVAIFGILIVFVGKDNVSNYNIPVLGHILYYYPRVGIIMGGVMALLSQILTI